jgi:hypothetical protein
MMPSSDDIPSTIVCHFDELEERIEDDDDVMMDVLDISTSIRSSFSDNHLMDLSRSGVTATGPKRDHVTNQDLCAMKDMVASMRRNPELLHQSPVMQRACLSSSCLATSHRFSPSRVPDETAARRNDDYVVKNEDLCAMKDMVASMRRNPELLAQSPVMQRACLTSPSLVTSHRFSPNLVVPDETATRHCVSNDDYDVKNEDLCAMKDMVASMRRNPELLHRSPVMQMACFTKTNTATAFTNDTPRLIFPNEITAADTFTTSHRRPLGTTFDPSTFPSLPLARGVSIGKNDVKVKKSSQR